MKRSEAREMAMRVAFGVDINPMSTEEILDTFFDREYYDSLAAEDELFSLYPDGNNLEYIKKLVSGIGAHSPELDEYIERYAKGWKFERISRIAVAIMKTAMFEILYMQDVPNGVAVNEAVEIAKKYETGDTISFINGILGSFIKGEVAYL